MPVKCSEKEKIIKNYRDLFQEHGEGPSVGQWSEEGQRFRFSKLVQIADLRGKSVLEIGCGIGDFYPFLRGLFGEVAYVGIDIVPELIDYAAKKYPEATFHCLDLLEDDFSGDFDYVLISGVFNNEIKDATEFLYRLATEAFKLCRTGLGFNFTSSYASRYDRGHAYHDPVAILRFCLENLSTKVTVAHHYERCDVAIFVYR